MASAKIFYICNLCMQVVSDEAVIEHLGSHLIDSFCKTCASTVDDVKSHIAIHLTKLLQCPTCKAIYSSSKDYRTHRDTHERKVCFHCGLSVDSDELLHDHIQTFHPVEIEKETTDGVSITSDSDVKHKDSSNSDTENYDDIIDGLQNDDKLIIDQESKVNTVKVKSENIAETEPRITINNKKRGKRKRKVSKKHNFNDKVKKSKKRYPLEKTVQVPKRRISTRFQERNEIHADVSKEDEDSNDQNGSFDQDDNFDVKQEMFDIEPEVKLVISSEKKSRGRPKGSRNKKVKGKVKGESRSTGIGDNLDIDNGIIGDESFDAKKKVGRPKGSRTKYPTFEQTNEVFKCQACYEEFASFKELSRHMNAVGCHLCSICGAKFKQKNNLMLHFRVHTGEKPNLCSICGKSFRTTGSLQSHLRRHNNEKPYTCRYCPKSFAEVGHRNRHERTHTGVRNHQCSVCGKLFSLPYHLRRHLLVHSGVKQFQCATCGKRIADGSNFRKHMAVHEKRGERVLPLKDQMINPVLMPQELNIPSEPNVPNYSNILIPMTFEAEQSKPALLQTITFEEQMKPNLTQNLTFEGEVLKQDLTQTVTFEGEPVRPQLTQTIEEITAL